VASQRSQLKLTKPAHEAQPITASVPVVVMAPAVVTSSDPPQRRWVQSVYRACYWLFRRLWRYLGTVCHEILVRLGVGVGFALLGACGLFALLAYIGVKSIDDVRPPEPRPPLAADNPNNHWKTIVTPEPKNSKRM